jgi:hydroxymethylglutaryl-CoA synthase
MEEIMSTDTTRMGVSAMAAYVPALRVQLQDWCEWTGNSWDKIQAVVGSSFRVPAQHENVYTMAANAVLRLIRQNDIDPREVGFLALGTESSRDNAAGAIIVKGMIDRALDGLGSPRLSRNAEVPELKHACLGGIYALKAALRYLACDARGKKAIVVAADVAEYERGSTGEQTQGAGAIAMLVEPRARLFEVDLLHAGTASDYRGPDFRKPFTRHFIAGYAPNTLRPSDFPIFSGKYSTVSYLDETVHAVEDMLQRLDTTGGKFYRQVRGLFFHRPYHLMPVQAMSFLYVRGLARGRNHHDELAALCTEAGVAIEDVCRETVSSPDLYDSVHRGEAPVEFYEATSRVAGVLRKHRSFSDLLAEKMSLGSRTMARMGNLYCAALPMWIAAGLEDAATTGCDLTGDPMVMVGYGSGDAADAIPIRAPEGWADAARRIALPAALAGGIDLTREQYESIHDGRDPDYPAYAPSDEFAISRVGQRYDSSFQDLGVEYYEFVSAAS